MPYITAAMVALAAAPAAWAGESMLKQAFRATVLAAACGLALWGKPSLAADDTIKIGFIGPLSGPIAPGTDEDVQALHYILDYVNAHQAPLGKKFELVTFDHKMQPAEALVALKQVIDQKMPVVLLPGLSHVAAALIDAVAKNNQGNPDRRIILLNGGAQATELTNEHCQFWHFRFVANAEQRTYALVKSIPADVKKVYLLNQDYLYGHSVEHDSKRFLGEMRPDIQIVGDEFIPLQQVKDFAPYIAKIKQSGAQSLITSNFGPDLTLLWKAGTDGRLDTRFDTYLGQGTGTVTAIGAAGVGRVTTIMEANENLAAEEHDAAAEQFDLAFRKDHKFGFDYEVWLAMFQMLSRSINEAGSLDPLKVALRLEGMQQKDLLGKTETMRKDDHQLILPLYVGQLSRDVKYDVEGTGLGWKTIAMAPADQLAMPTSCKMERPAS